MPIGTCDPASRGDAWNVVELSRYNGQTLVRAEYGWDGVSTRETGCVGPLNSMTVYNRSSTTTYYAHFKGRRGAPKMIELRPGYERTFNSAQLVARGFVDNTDLDDLYITDSSTPPTNW